MRARVKRLEDRRRRGRRALASAAAITLALGGVMGTARGASASEEAADAAAAPAAPEPPPRPKELPPLDITEPPFTRHVDFGGGVALVHRIPSGDTGVRYPASVGMGLWARVDITRYLRASLYAVRTERDFNMPSGALGLVGDPGDAEFYTYSFGLRIAPTWRITPRARAWVSAGAGWGRLELGRFSVATSGGSVFPVRERAASFVEIPLGLGASFDVVPRWLALEIETTGAFYPETAQRGRAFEEEQAIDASGRRVTVGPFPRFAGGFVTTLGLSLVL
ncbi:hypothetical protein [Polyangium sorediatum]|uniref:Outer membrane protein beta-barrel domain-containing protein n=1 Tax=Polyangium sorediatum TaxID=889274 RepID=A0ABT6P004_9BACT|nr:hypothetical protein [Polyangium sorediatum]MDI1433930.1 hypothetical protein [Polyangium sorediatum]